MHLHNVQKHMIVKIQIHILNFYVNLLLIYWKRNFTKKYDKIVMGSLIDGLGFGNASTTLGHALSYVYSNEGISHGHALAFTTTYAHEFNESKF